MSVLGSLSMTRDDLDRIRGQKERHREELEAELVEKRRRAAAMASQVKRVADALEDEDLAKPAPYESGVNHGTIAFASSRSRDFYESYFFPSAEAVIELLGDLEATKQKLAEVNRCLDKMRAQPRT